MYVYIYIYVYIYVWALRDVRRDLGYFILMSYMYIYIFINIYMYDKFESDTSNKIYANVCMCIYINMYGL
jgi:hypothetical protein